MRSGGVTLTRGRPSPPVHRLRPGPECRALVRIHWVPVWSIPDGETWEQRVLQHPCCNLVVGPDYALSYGVVPGLSTVTLQGEGWVFGTLLQRLLAKRRGLTPKWLIQRRRLHDAVAGLSARTRSLADLAADLGYTDEAHFTHDVREATGLPPGAFAELPGLAPRRLRRWQVRPVRLTPRPPCPLAAPVDYGRSAPVGAPGGCRASISSARIAETRPRTGSTPRRDPRAWPLTRGC